MATRLYYSNSTVAATPAFYSGWQNTAQAIKKVLSATKDNSSEISNPITINNQEGCGFQLVSPPMSAGIVFTSGSTTVQSFFRAATSTGGGSSFADAILRIVSIDGNTVRAMLRSSFGSVLIPVSSGLSVEFFTSLALNNTYTTVVGDRLVLEIGSSSSAIPTMTYWLNSATASSDITVAGQATGASWIELSNTITFIPEPTLSGTTGMMVNTGSLGVRA